MSLNFPDFPFFNFDSIDKLLGQLNIPVPSAGEIMTASRKNVEALTAANRTALEGYHAVAKRQAEIVRETMLEVTNLLHGDTAPSSEKGAELLRNALDRALVNMSEMAELSTKAVYESLEVIQKRASDCLSDIKDSSKSRGS